MELIGTNYFKSQRHAERYYADYGCDAAEVARKITDGEIRIRSQPFVAPELFNGKTVKSCRLIDNGTRWQVEV